MHFLLSWPGIAVAGIIGMVLWGLRFVFADFLLDRLGDPLSDRLLGRDGLTGGRSIGPIGIRAS